MELVRLIPPSESYKLGIELLLSSLLVDNVFRTYAAEDMEVRTFQVSQFPFREKEYSYPHTPCQNK